MLTTEDYTKAELLELLKVANEFKEGKTSNFLKDIFVANLFFENSTRTKCSFEMAEHRLGMKIIPFDVSKSSVSKGETLYDTVKTLESIGLDAVVIRHPKNQFYKELENIKIPVINGGDGTGNHPTQTLLDLMTIQQEFGNFENLTIAIIGDIQHSRVAHSLQSALEKMGSKVYFSGPEIWMEEKNKAQYIAMDDLIAEMDVVYLLRIQHERHEGNSDLDMTQYLQNFGLTKEREKMMKENSIIMHPAPINRGVEIDSDLVECERSRIFKQMENGVYARMAILKSALEIKGYKCK
ncbi:aspartate carbamoyltransferase catalytic subunit [Frigoriflavimonas asaccharolytica]|uniref:Aspartate carbamoyltransferase n=1 Tax=Frigoriflavimonas asaccharolytica TaxID=2735899 RepID=A0A8J8K815_9FLAO|nr:aspartate carbamoyltransferase catalytic subunit [Frigoriflavimonas asaccharolytica]NRS92086.1 aspartate carbamoyltransferase catalytic subunit [Frigoriflavimonas asaccharolytica]